jgi:ketosteroid isomerase-like protein
MMLESLPTTSTGSSASYWRINDVEITDFALARQAMTPNKQIIQKYMDAFGRTDHAEILSCLTDDVEWLIPGAFHVAGKQAFDEQIENDAFVGRPTIRVTRMIEENGVVVAEGSVSSAKKDGGMLNAVFCDVFVMRDAKIRHLTSYLMDLSA